MISADAFIHELVPGGTIIKVANYEEVVYQGKAEEIDFDLVCAYDVLMVRPISMHYYGNVLEIIIG